MDLKLKCSFRNRIFSCNAYIDSTDYPCYVFVELVDKELVSEFGEEVTIKTDFDKLLSRKDDYPKLVLLLVAILDSIKKTPEYEKAKRQCEQKKILAYKSM